MGAVRIGTLEELRARKSLKFTFREEGIEREGFVVWFEGQVLAYENACRHIPIPLDYGDNQFFTSDGHSLLCQNHGAVYDPLTGVCTRGPCPGARLRKLQLSNRAGVLFYNES